jgi:DNA topoisomerase-1
LTNQAEEEEDEKEPSNPVPELEVGQKLRPVDKKILSKKTKPPARYTEASLIKALEKNGVGRPSTYAAIMDRIVSGLYVEINKRQLAATPLGCRIIEALVGNFLFAEIAYTKDMEKGLDDIAQGNLTYLTLITGVWEKLTEEIKNAVNSDAGAAGRPKCPKCGSIVHHYVKTSAPGKKGYNFWGCTNRNKCDATFDEVNGQPVVRGAYTCPDCGKPLRRVRGLPDMDFLGCSTYPECKFSTKSGADGAPIL